MKHWRGKVIWILSLLRETENDETGSSTFENRAWSFR